MAPPVPNPGPSPSPNPNPNPNRNPNRNPDPSSMFHTNITFISGHKTPGLAVLIPLISIKLADGANRIVPCNLDDLKKQPMVVFVNIFGTIWILFGPKDVLRVEDP